MIILTLSWRGNIFSVWRRRKLRLKQRRRRLLRRNRNRRGRLLRRHPLLHVQRPPLRQPRRLALVRLRLRRRELQHAQLVQARLQVRQLPLMQHRKQHLQRRNPESRPPAHHQQLGHCGLVWSPQLALHLLQLRDLQRRALLLDRLAHRQFIALPQRLAPIGRPVHSLRVNDIQQVLALLREQAKVARRRDFDRQLRGVPAHRVLGDRHHVFHNAQAAAAEDVRAKAQ